MPGRACSVEFLSAKCSVDSKVGDRGALVAGMQSGAEIWTRICAPIQCETRAAKRRACVGQPAAAPGRVRGIVVKGRMRWRSWHCEAALGVEKVECKLWLLEVGERSNGGVCRVRFQARPSTVGRGGLALVHEDGQSDVAGR